MSSKRIGIIPDHRLSREKRAILSEKFSALHHIADLDFLDPDIKESELLERLMKSQEIDPYTLILAPWYSYLEWSRIEAFFGTARTKGPTFAGYYSEATPQSSLAPIKPSTIRSLLFDFQHLSGLEIKTLFGALIEDEKRTGILPLLTPDTSIYCESWYSSHGLGNRLDAVLSLPEVEDHEWAPRSNAIRFILMALWSLIYEDGPAKSVIGKPNKSTTPKAHLQVGIDETSFLLRLCYQMPTWTPKDVLDHFWPESHTHTHYSQVLFQFADLIRVQTLAETKDIELTVGLLKSATSQRSPHSNASLWIDWIHPSLVSESPTPAHGKRDRHIKILPGFAPPQIEKPHFEESAPDISKQKIIERAKEEIQELRKEVVERDKFIRELKSGGVGAPSKSQAPLEINDLLDTFQERFLDAEYEIEQFKEHLVAIQEKGNVSEDEYRNLKGRMDELAKREQEWVTKVAELIANFKNARSKNKKKVAK